MLARHEELFIREGSGLSPSRKTCLVLVDASAVFHRKWFRQVESFDPGDIVVRSLATVLEALLEEGLQVSGLFPPERLISDLGVLNLNERQDLLASLPPVPLLMRQEGSVGNIGILYYFCSTIPGSDFLAYIEKQYPRAGKVLILPHSRYREEIREGWTVVKA